MDPAKIETIIKWEALITVKGVQGFPPAECNYEIYDKKMLAIVR